MHQPIKILSICGKTSDMCSIQAKTQDGKVITEYSGYVPDFFPGEHYGDYLMFDIDVKTGQILNWPKGLTQAVLKRQLVDLED
jgi:hypothetical protein